jgi:hypothetical protein
MNPSVPLGSYRSAIVLDANLERSCSNLGCARHTYQPMDTTARTFPTTIAHSTIPPSTQGHRVRGRDDEALKHDQRHQHHRATARPANGPPAAPCRISSLLGRFIRGPSCFASSTREWLTRPRSTGSSLNRAVPCLDHLATSGGTATLGPIDDSILRELLHPTLVGRHPLQVPSQAAPRARLRR